MSREKSYNRAISSSHRTKLARLETDIIMESFHQPTSNLTLLSKNKSQITNDVPNENELQKNELQNINKLQNKDNLENKNELQSGNENISENENLLSNNDNISNESEFDQNITSNHSDSEPDENIDFKKFLADWAVSECIPQSSLRLLLKGIKQYTCQNCSYDIPSDPRTLVHTPRTTYIDVCANAARWPNFTSHTRFEKAVKANISPDENWSIYIVKRILGTANTYEKGLQKLKKVEYLSDLNSESDDSEKWKKSRKDRAKKIVSSDEDCNTDNKDDENIQLSPYPKIPHIKKNICSAKINKSCNSKKQLTNKISRHKEKEETLENTLSETNCFTTLRKNTHSLISDTYNFGTVSCGATLDKDKQIILNESPDEHFKTMNDELQNANSLKNYNSSSSSDVQRYMIRKLTDIGFQISSIEKQERLLNEKLDIMLHKFEKYFFHEEIIEKEFAEQCLMDNFPIDNIEDLEEFEKSLTNDTAKRTELVILYKKIEKSIHRTVYLIAKCT